MSVTPIYFLECTPLLLVHLTLPDSTFSGKPISTLSHQPKGTCASTDTDTDTDITVTLQIFFHILLALSFVWYPENQYHDFMSRTHQIP